jgi:cytoskeletal protein RodZ
MKIVTAILVALWFIGWGYLWWWANRRAERMPTKEQNQKAQARFRQAQAEKGRRQAQFFVTDDEKKAIARFLAELRKGQD